MSAVKVDTSWVAGLIVVAVLFAGGCSADTLSEGSPTPASDDSAAVDTTSDRPDGDSGADGAMERLAALPIKPRASKDGYDRAEFGQAWTDDVTVDGGRNGCDTRNDILGRDLVYTTTDPMSRDCTVLSGTLEDAYTGKQLRFVRGPDTPSAVQIDHVVALSDAWQKGAQELDEATRRNLANDPRNLQAVDGPTNQAKSDSDASEWLPPNSAYRCTYVERQIEVKIAYGLWVTQAEHDAMARELASCGGAGSGISSTEGAGSKAPTSQPTLSGTSPMGVSTLTGEVYYPNCTAARAAGAAPLRIGQPGYRLGMDGDGDGVACE
ncbi:GmrSD restriction endonuclease domain-containing protein [Rhodococcus spongiicola]|uniref:DUF1524 domain-containing protein n=1 Tax=Rhodococcus spongiicola TaxID=2487352 RepID=A0A438ASV4_9NOCA|nr:DUF1524 domain-containing protein [Rhodococcus spongiicola]RVW01735.1 DUF1524 domain-containing protein [Rhodococcus spongiicola]